MKVMLRSTAMAFFAWSGSAQAQVTPYNSWRALIVYSNPIDSIYSLGSGINMYEGYLAAIFDGINQVYEDSEVEVRAQIAGVVWDKAYVENNCSTCTVGHLSNQTNGMERWTSDSILTKYAVDVVILVHQIANDPFAGGAALPRTSATSDGYGVFWTRYVDHLITYAHEIGHIFSIDGNGDHCYSGHRRVVDALGKEIGGPLPDTMSLILGVSSGQTYILHDTVETDISHAYRGFHTTMAYGTGDGYPFWTYPCHQHYNDTNGGVARTFRFMHQGVGWGMPGGNDWRPEWTGTYSNPDIMWWDVPTNTPYPTGADTISYVNRLRYKGESTDVFRDTIKYHRNFSDTLNTYAATIRELRNIPTSLSIGSSMSLGQNSADSQWVYAHFAAASSVVIEPGFRVGVGGSMKISVGGQGGMLAKRGATRPDNKTTRAVVTEMGGLDVKYDPAVQALFISAASGLSSGIAVTVYDLKGVQIKKQVLSTGTGGRHSESLNVKELPKGVYVVRVVSGKKRLQRQFVKW
jgi:hypothetical protein